MQIERPKVTSLITIQEKIGARIAEHRKALGLTMKALAERTENLKPSRINNWERGVRTPGPEEAIQLAKALEISPAYLLGLTDNAEIGVPSKMPGLLTTVPILDYQEACNPKKALQNSHIDYIPLSNELKGKISTKTFALRIKDDSMNPLLKVNDIVILDGETEPKPGDIVAAQIKGENEIIVRQYKQISYTGSFELNPINTNWAKVTVDTEDSGVVIAIVLEIRKFFS